MACQREPEDQPHASGSIGPSLAGDEIEDSKRTIDGLIYTAEEYCNLVTLSAGAP